MKISEALDQLASPEERVRLERMKAEAGLAAMALLAKGEHPHGQGKSRTRLDKRQAKNKRAKAQRKANRGAYRGR